MLDIIISQRISNEKSYQTNTQKLYTLLPKDMLANIIYFHSIHITDDKE